MLGLGRALGETMAVAMVLSAGVGRSRFNLISSDEPGDASPPTSRSTSESDAGTKVNVLIATGLVLFVITFAVNFLGPLDRRPQRVERLTR